MNINFIYKILQKFKIRVNTVNPGFVNTGFGVPSALAAKDAAEELKEMVKKQALDLNIGKATHLVFVNFCKTIIFDC